MARLPDLYPPQAFVLGEELIDAVSMQEVNATYNDMKALGLNKPPYPRFDVIVPYWRIIRVVNTETGEDFRPDPKEHVGLVMRLRYEGDGNYRFLLTRKGETIDFARFCDEFWKHRGDKRPENVEVLEEQCQRSGNHILRLLTVLLATKNIVKETTPASPAKWAMKGGPAGMNRYTTTIRIGEVTEHASSGSSGGTRRPHLRRGHIRNQHFGPGNQYVKQVFIEPVFVNADKGWIAERTAYNLGGPSGKH